VSLVVVRETVTGCPGEWLDAGATDIFADGIEAADLKIRLHAAVRWAERFQEELDHQQQAQSTLSGGLAHDYNNLLSAIQGNIDLSLMDPKVTTGLRYNLEQISLATQKAADLTRQVLDSSRFQPGVAPALNVNESVRRLRGKMTAAAGGRGVEVRLDRAAPLARIGAALLEETVAAMVQTAQEIIPTAEGRLEIATLASPEGGAVLEVRALGAPDEVSLRVGCCHLAAPTAGLEAAGAKLSLPTPHILRVAFPALGGPASGRSGTGGFEERSSGTILLVDDEDGIRTATHQLLRREGYTVLEASSGEEALGLFRSIGGMLDAVVLDLNMPAMSGGEVLRHMRHLRPEIRMVVWSGLPADVARTHINGMSDVTFVEKPARLADFPGILTRILRDS
jgi:CheY-like chemotaxis protein